jgi:hypothetical protein
MSDATVKRFMRCEKCHVVIRTTGEDAYSEFHAKGCNGELRLDTRTCQAVLFHGPGHQSTARCEATGAHDVHHAVYVGQYAEWTGMEAMTGYFNEPPEEPEE